MVIVQVARTTWTKASRGQPGASARAAVPDGFRIEAVEPTSAAPPDGLVVETVRLAEGDGFVAVRDEPSTTTLPGRVAGTTIELDGTTVRVTRLDETGSAWPNRTPRVVAFRLAPGEWGRLIRNYRHSGYHGWSYEKTVVNVAHLGDACLDRSLFVRTEPDHVRDEQQSLF